MLSRVSPMTHVSCHISEDVISVWNRSASNAEGIEKIRETVKRLLRIPSFVQVRRVMCLLQLTWTVYYKLVDANRTNRDAKLHPAVQVCL